MVLYLLIDSAAPLILAFGASALILPVGFVMLMLYPKKYGVLLNLFRLGKMLAVIPLLFLTIDFLFLVLLVSYRKEDESRSFL
jgi:ATP/ADP translocase